MRDANFDEPLAAISNEDEWSASSEHIQATYLLGTTVEVNECYTFIVSSKHVLTDLQENILNS